MGKIVRHTMVITIIETWTLTWADGTERTVTYRSRQFYQPLPSADDDPQSASGLEVNTNNADRSNEDAGNSE
jgi:hypothetical protein